MTKITAVVLAVVLGLTAVAGTAYFATQKAADDKAQEFADAMEEAFAPGGPCPVEGASYDYETVKAIGDAGICEEGDGTAQFASVNVCTDGALLLSPTFGPTKPGNGYPTFSSVRVLPGQTAAVVTSDGSESWYDLQPRDCQEEYEATE